MSQLLKIVTCVLSSTTSEASSGSSTSSIAYSIPSWHIIWWFLVVLHSIILGLRWVVLWLCIVVWLLCSVVLLLSSIVWSWGLIELWRFFPSHNFGLYPVGVRCSLPHHLHSYAIFVFMAYRLTKSAITILGNCQVLMHHCVMIRVMTRFLAYFTP
jgi:hypothetical protein